MPQPTERVIEDLESERRARNLMQVFAGELGATYDSIRDEYQYTREDGRRMRLGLRMSKKSGLRAEVYIQEVEAVLT